MTALRGMHDGWMQRHAPWLLALPVVLLPIGRSAELGIVVVAVLGVIAAFGARYDSIARRELRLPLVLFACYWLPALASCTDAVEPGRSWSATMTALRFLPFAIFAVLALRSRALALERLHTIAAAVTALWALDACMQGVTGWSLGGHLDTDRVSGIFGDDNLKLGPVLGVLSPFALEQAYRRWRWRGFIPVWALFAVAILLAGMRAAWIAYALVTIVFAWRLAANPRQRVALLLAPLVMGLAIGVVAYHLSDRFEARVARTLALGRGTLDGLDFAVAGRVPIWRTAAHMAAAHPINGVGVRGFRYAYVDYADAGDHWVDPDTGEGAMHPHQLLLELAAETGIIGVLAWTFGAIYAWRAWRRRARTPDDPAFAPGLALLAMCFPLNTHFAFYSSFWALLLWWLLALWCAAVARGDEVAT